MSGPHIRPAIKTDIDMLERLENRVFDGERLSRRSLAAYITNPRVYMPVAERGAMFAGYALLAFRKGSSVARLYSIAIVPELYANGIGTKLMLACEAEANERARTRLQLEVRADNPAAIGLYKKLHYHQFDTYEDFYEDGMTALRFERTLKHTT